MGGLKIAKRLSNAEETRHMLTINASGQAPGEALIVAILRYAETHRATMSQENRDAYDKLTIAMMTGWHNWWVSQGWPGIKI